MCSRSTRAGWVGDGINVGSVELWGGAIVYLYNMQAFTLAMIVHCTVSRSCTMAVLESFDAGCAPEPSFGCSELLGKGAAQLHNHRSIVSSDRLPTTAQNLLNKCCTQNLPTESLFCQTLARHQFASHYFLRTLFRLSQVSHICRRANTMS
jgi:hypothetical protein